MSGKIGAVHPTAMPGLGLDTRGRWHLRAVQEGRAVVETYVLPGSVHPPPSAAGGGRAPVRLPSLVAAAVGPHSRSSRALLSHSEPSLLIPDENVLFESFSSHRRPSVAPKRAPPPPPPFSKSSVRLSCETGRPPVTSAPRQQQQSRQQVRSCSRPAYIHFSQAIQLGPKPRPVRNGFRPPSPSPEMVHSGLTVRPYHNSPSQGEPLSVVGRPCLLSYAECPPLAAAAADCPARAQLHVFLPTEAEGEEEGSESVDEGFMEEMDSKITSLKLQRGALKTATIPPML